VEYGPLPVGLATRDPPLLIGTLISKFILFDIGSVVSVGSVVPVVSTVSDDLVVVGILPFGIKDKLENMNTKNTKIENI
jgi:hypothetical protein